MSLKDKLSRPPADTEGNRKPTLENLLEQAGRALEGPGDTDDDGHDLGLTNYGPIQSDSIESLRVAHAKDPSNRGMTDLLANLLYTAKQYPEAAELYRELLTADPENGRQWMFFANCLAALDRWDEAFDAYSRAACRLKDATLKLKCEKRLAYAARKSGPTGSGRGGPGDGPARS